MRIFAFLAGGAIGGVVGYLVAAIVGCKGLYPTRNLCGIYGAFFTDPLGFLAGPRAGWLATRPHRQ